MSETPAQIGKYPVVDKLGEGGFGIVYRAKDPNIGRDVAIKILMQSSQANIARFRLEAATAGNLSHPNIVTVYDFGEHDGRPYIVMELLDGQDLKQRIDEGAGMPLVDAMNVMSQASAGLHFAHEYGVVHRDVKPANLRVLPDGTVRIMDFGIARITENMVASLTEQGNIVGSLKYMAPERFDGFACDRRVDIFGYGIVYYQLLTGVHPFDAPGLTDLIQRIRTLDPAPIRGMNPQCPPELEAAVFRALEKRPEQRYGTLHDFDLDVERAIAAERSKAAAEFAEQAGAHVREGRSEEAVGLVRKALRLDPNNEAARRLRDGLRDYRIETSPGRRAFVPPPTPSRAQPVPEQGPTQVPAPRPPAAAPVGAQHGPEQSAARQEIRRQHSKANWKVPAILGGSVLAVACLTLAIVTRVATNRPEPQPPPAATNTVPSPVAPRVMLAPEKRADPVTPTGRPPASTSAGSGAPANAPAPAGKARLFIRPSTLAFRAAEGSGATGFAVAQLSPGQSRFSFTAMPDENWIVLRSGEDRGPCDLHVATDPRSLAPGEYEGSVTILSDEASGGPLRLGIRLVVTAR